MAETVAIIAETDIKYVFRCDTPTWQNKSVDLLFCELGVKRNKQGKEI